MAKTNKKKIGIEGEAEAASFLKKEGYKIVEKNYICNLGEIDIIAIHKKILVFVEVKVRSTDSFGSPELSVTKHKRRQIIRVAESYLSRNRIQDTDCRFDVVAISYNFDKEIAPAIKLLKNAFQLDDI
ncbi:MAG: YraN family protein [Candidatus Anammoxibacter sp.]